MDFSNNLCISFFAKCIHEGIFPTLVSFYERTQAYLQSVLAKQRHPRLQHPKNNEISTTLNSVNDESNQLKTVFRNRSKTQWVLIILCKIISTENDSITQREIVITMLQIVTRLHAVPQRSRHQLSQHSNSTSRISSLLCKVWEVWFLGRDATSSRRSWHIFVQRPNISFNAGSQLQGLVFNWFIRLCVWL